MENQSCSDPAFGIIQLRRSGAVVVVFGLISFGLAVAIDQYMSEPNIGYWFASMVTILAGLFALSAISRGKVVVCCVASIVAVCLSMFGSSGDGIYAGILTSLESCVGHNGQPYGSTNVDFLSFAQNCSTSSDAAGYDCSCTDSTGNCFYFDGQSNCNLVLGKYTKMVQAATAFHVLSLVFALVLSIVTCCSLCCPANLSNDSWDLYQYPHRAIVYAIPAPIMTVAQPTNPTGSTDIASAVVLSDISQQNNADHTTIEAPRQRFEINDPSQSV